MVKKRVPVTAYKAYASGPIAGILTYIADGGTLTNVDPSNVWQSIVAGIVVGLLTYFVPNKPKYQENNRIERINNG